MLAPELLNQRVKCNRFGHGVRYCSSLVRFLHAVAAPIEGIAAIVFRIGYFKGIGSSQFNYKADFVTEFWPAPFDLAQAGCAQALAPIVA